MFGAISGIEPSDKINVKNVQKPQGNNFEKGITKHYKLGIFFSICLLMKYKSIKKKRVKRHVKNEYNKKHCKSFLSQLNHI